MRAAVLLILLAVTIVGASALAFLCDDAFITFRYVSNAMAGHGLVWNPPPFQPVEGYTGFSWALLLWAVWKCFGVEPPAAANVLSIAFGVCQFAVIATAALRLRRRDGQRVGDAIALLTIACIVGNRSFLQWMTSGLETALFNLAHLLWVVLAFVPAERRDRRWLAKWSAAAALAALTRPDGLLFVAATATAAPLAFDRANRSLRALATGLLPLGLVAVHVAWRRWFYGDWLPNTYYAKVVEPWPEAGVPFLKCFLFEHGLWLWFPVAAVWAAHDTWRHRTSLLATTMRRMPAFAALGAIVIHVGYYVYQVGGDHFEYRVLSQLVPIGWLSLAAMGAQLMPRVWPTIALLVVTFLASTAGWLHLWISRDMPMNGVTPLADRVPAVLRPIWRWHDSLQMFLHIHFVGMRCNQIAAALAHFQTRYPPRGDFNTDPGDIAVQIDAVVGTTGWYLRDVAIIDWLGLNDWVVARTKPFGREHTEAAFQEHARVIPAADTNGDGFLDRSELARWIGSFFPAQIREDDASPAVDMAINLYAGHRGDALTPAEAEAFLRGILSRGAMAHERVPPPGYVDAFERNVTVSPEGVVVTPRAVKLKPRIPAIEAEWREKARRGELKAQ